MLDVGTFWQRGGDLGGKILCKVLMSPNQLLQGDRDGINPPRTFQLGSSKCFSHRSFGKSFEKQRFLRAILSFQGAAEGKLFLFKEGFRVMLNFRAVLRS